LRNYPNACTSFRSFFDLPARRSELAELTRQSTQPDFWSVAERAQTTMRRIADLDDLLTRVDKLATEVKDTTEMMGLFDESDEAAREELSAQVEAIGRELDALEERAMFRSAEDTRSAILSIHPGAGGTESCDWAEMLYRMLTRYIELQGLKYEVLDLQPNDEAGIKDATLEVSGAYAYGLLKSEIGVHRLVRVSPFDANKRRHTSFAAVSVYPEVEEIEVEINPSDLKFDTFRAGGHGGQNVNKVSSAVRITHIPSGIVVVCQNERSQFQNKTNALKILRSRLYDFHKREQDEKREKFEASKSEIAWGHQIRSYVFFPYQQVKDHRTDYTSHDLVGIMDGHIDAFVHAYLTRPEAAQAKSARAD
jgi:peptide chain release factor 2